MGTLWDLDRTEAGPSSWMPSRPTKSRKHGLLWPASNAVSRTLQEESQLDLLCIGLSSSYLNAVQPTWHRAFHEELLHTC